MDPRQDEASSRAAASLVRRLKFAGDSRLFFDRLAERRWVRRLTRMARDIPLHRVPDRLAMLAFDLAECARLRRWAPAVGEPRNAIIATSARIPQHSRYPGYWYDSSNHSMVGLQIGMDLIRHAGRYHLIEINLDAAMRPARRALYDTEFDPIVSGLVAAARANGFKKLVPYSREWSSEYVKEFTNAGERQGIEVVPTVSAPGSPGRCRFASALPEKHDPGTLYVVFCTRHTPMDYYVHDKYGSSTWPSHLTAPEEKRLLSWVPVGHELAVPPLDSDGYWPNVVTKLSGRDKGTGVLLAKVRDERHALQVLGMRHRRDLPRPYKRDPWFRFVNAVTGRGRVLYQPFIPPETDSRGRAMKLRLHMLVSPLAREFLSIHGTVSAQKLPAEIPFGLVESASALRVNYTPDPGYCRLDTATEEEARQVANEFGQTLDQAIKLKFETSPPTRDWPSSP